MLIRAAVTAALVLAQPVGKPIAAEQGQSSLRLERVGAFHLASSELEKRDEYERTPLMLAASLGDIEMVTRLVVQGADINAVDKIGWTALFYAAYHDHLAIYDYLLQSGSSPDARDIKLNFARDYSRKLLSNSQVSKQFTTLTIHNKSVRPSAPPILSASVTLEEHSGDLAVDAEELAALQLHVKNSGKGLATQLKAVLSTLKHQVGISIPSTFAIGDLAPGAEKVVTIPISSNQKLENGNCTVEINLVDAFDFDAPPSRISFDTRAFVPPVLDVQQVGTEDGNGNGLIERGEQVDLKVLVANRGGLARNVMAKLVIGDSRIKHNGNETVSLGMIEGGAWKEAEFSVFVANRYDGAKRLPISVRLEESHPELVSVHPLQVMLNQDSQRINMQVVRAKPESGSLTAEMPDYTIDVDKAPEISMKNPHAYAVVIGIERYSAQVPSVTYARRDAAIFREYLVKTLGVPEGNIEFLTDEKATLGNIRTALEGKLAHSIEEGVSDVYIYYAGHGAPDASTKLPYLIPSDGNPAYPSTSCYPLGSFYGALSKMGAKSVTVVLDACFSGASGRGEQSETLLANARPMFIHVKADAVPQGVTVFAAADGEQMSSGDDKKKHGLFTYYFLKGLQGEADGDRDRAITTAELQQYVHANVSKAARKLNREQTPVLLGQDQQRVLLRLK